MLWVLLLLPLIHYIADFRFQSDEMALKKSKSLKWLTIHVGIYALCFTVVFGWLFGVITFITHFLVDFVTSKQTSKLWFIKFLGKSPQYLMFNETNKEVPVWDCQLLPTRHRFFCMIGLDQMIHQYCLLITALALDTKVIWI